MNPVPDQADDTVAPSWMPGIEILRGIAALLVVVHHLWSLSTQPRFAGYWLVEGFGSFGVNIFFVLSAFLLSAPFWSSSGTSLRSYGVRRLMRIYPAYLANVVVLFLFMVPAEQLLTPDGVRQLWANLTFTHYLRPTTSSSFGTNGALWTLTIEFILYLMLPLFAIAFRRGAVIAFAMMIAVGSGWRWWVATNGDGLREFYFGRLSDVPEGIQSLFVARQFIGFIAVFAVGIGGRWVYEHGRIGHWFRGRPAVRWWWVLVALVPGALALVWVERASMTRHPWWFTWFDTVVVLLVVPAIWLAARTDATRSDPVQRLGIWLGQRSYGIYLWHFPLILVFYERGITFAAPDLSPLLPRVVGALLLTLVFAAVSYRALELPAQAFGRRLAKRWVGR